jgi:hypothetical protein
MLGQDGCDVHSLRMHMHILGRLYTRFEYDSSSLWEWKDNDAKQYIFTTSIFHIYIITHNHGMQCQRGTGECRHW